MASYCSDLRRRLPRRETSLAREASRAGSSKRPRLPRASTTAPCINTSTVSRSSFANSESSRRAADMLNHVAIHACPAPDSNTIRTASPLPSSEKLYSENSRRDNLSTSPSSHSEGFDHIYAGAGCYFSFPSFDLYEEASEQGEEKHSSMKAP